ncbi:hypothetical protein RHMOL_Rhmol12G0206300 [Rhododendron molle]|uniref:Uncharacterized protein n=1 Tax=Rhododendron molle TaxID=49168 RepID=A0ACC0LK96_RHOML|nr:hypothetical protein RHMOL_Rhmol12G0206300 [Rhododendron molle]
MGKSRPCTKKRKITDEDVAEYLAKRVAKKLKAAAAAASYHYSTDEVFVWQKKIEHRVISQGIVVPLDQMYSAKSEKKKQRERMAEIENLKQRREERAIEEACREEERALLVRERARAEFQDWESKEGESDSDRRRRRSRSEADNLEKAMGATEEGDAVFGGSSDQANLDSPVCTWRDEYCPRKPKYSNRVHTGYEWNKIQPDSLRSRQPAAQGCSRV